MPAGLMISITSEDISKVESNGSSSDKNLMVSSDVQRVNSKKSKVKSFSNPIFYAIERELNDEWIHIKEYGINYEQGLIRIKNYSDEWMYWKMSKRLARLVYRMVHTEEEIKTGHKRLPLDKFPTGKYFLKETDERY